ncbi:hypothetical protein K470DRAFT_257923 [Piedraia hortae CBS 480.64]|uniref:Uncharacterized protein n=1 Tax=Piedraia hortae CBS 480.64 TaxID=1314780 RepID=A0A6A7C0L8_9PEZI|nr:hypothetical protein K470DRAFT_257923 [Piedraia hortae CBS 480.64]
MQTSTCDLRLLIAAGDDERFGLVALQPDDTLILAAPKFSAVENKELENAEFRAKLKVTDAEALHPQAYAKQSITSWTTELNRVYKSFENLELSFDNEPQTTNNTNNDNNNNNGSGEGSVISAERLMELCDQLGERFASCFLRGVRMCQDRRHCPHEGSRRIFPSNVRRTSIGCQPLDTMLKT